MARELTLDETFERLEEAIGSLEQEDISLEESFKLYKEGMKLVKSCNDKIDKVEKEVLKLNGNDETEELD
ncbi:MAG: exodeoxyribonuclease VII small subunit [Lachnospiraceae bacterium]|nr:exodeoxyribonuclease VII small subunit [Lachnospiraceae bacterium]